MEDIAPQVFELVPKQRVNRTVLKALNGQSWHIQGALTVGVISEVLSLWDAISSVSLQPGVEDSMPKRFSGDGNYSAKSAYDALQEMITFSPWERIW